MKNPGLCGCEQQLGNSDQELVELIVREVQGVLRKNRKLTAHISKTDSGNPLIPVGVSNRHIHLTSKTFHLLFGEASAFESMRPLYQEGEFASKHMVTVVGPKLRSIPNVRVLGPLRKYDQVEISLTDAIFLGINPPVANSGALEDAAPLTLVGPNSLIYCERCAIIAGRHIHLSNIEAAALGLKNGDYCKVRISGEKSIVFEKVLVRTNDNWRLQMHLDTDDANAANIRDESFAELIGKM